MAGGPPIRAETPGVALANLLYGDPQAAARALLAPDTLSPAEADRQVSELLLHSHVDEGFFGHILETVTDPFVILGVALSFGFPLPTAAGLRQVSQKLAPMLRRPGVTRYLKGVWNLFKDMDEEVLKPFYGVIDERNLFRLRHEGVMREGLDKFYKAVGRDPDRYETFLMASWLDGLHEELPKAFKHWKRPITGREVGQLRSPFKPGAIEREMSPELKELAGTVRRVFDDVYDDVVMAHPEMREELVNAMIASGMRGGKEAVARRIEQGGLKISAEVKARLKNSPAWKKTQSDIREQLGAPDAALLEVGPKIEGDYWPHQFPRDMTEFNEWVKSLLMTSSEKSMGRRAVQGMDAAFADSLHKRLGRMLPDPRELERYEHLLEPEAFDELKRTVVGYRGTPDGVVLRKTMSGLAEDTVPVYSLDFERVTTRYLNQMGSTYAFNRNGNGRRLKEAVGYLKSTGQSWRAHALEDTLIPQAAGKMEFQQAVRAQEWAGRRTRMLEFMEGNVGKKLFGEGTALGGLGKWIRKGLEDPRGPWGHTSFSGPLASWLYAGALGFNASPVLMNSLQTVLTTAPLIGMRNAVRGFETVLKKGERYLGLRLQQGMEHGEAFRTAFKEFYESGLAEAPGVAEMLDQGFRASRGARGVKTLADRVQRGLMSAFTVSEVTNRLVAFEGAQAFARAGRMSAEEGLDLARWVVRETQFPSGVESSPYILTKLRNLPFGRLITQFMQFPLRSLEFLTTTATTAGSMGKDIAGRNFGTLGRMVLYGGLARHAGEALGLDLSRGLVFGVMPEPREGSPFAPMPVPPMMSIVGAAWQDLFSGEFDQLKYALPLMVPGGVGAVRMVGYASPELAQALGRKYVDYEQTTPDGRYAVYSAATAGAPSLVGYMTAGQLIARGLGLPTTDAPGSEAQAMRWLVANRDRIREYKRRFVEAIAKQDFQTANLTDAEFQKAYPEIQGGLASLVKKSDLKALEVRRQVARAERILDTMPAPMRPLFAQAIMGTALGRESGFLGINPEFLGTGTVQTRMPLRVGAMANVPGPGSFYGGG